MTVRDRTSVDTNSSIESFHSASAIPRPISGTTRREIPATRFKLFKATSSLTSEQARRPLRGAPQIRECEGETQMTRESKSYLPALEDHISRFDTIFDNKEALFPLRHPLKPPRHLPQSHTSPTLLSPSKEIKAHTLLRPLDPPLPRSRTCDDMTGLAKSQKATKHPSPVSIQLSANDRINRKRIETQRERDKEFTTMFLNTTTPMVHDQNAVFVSESKLDEECDPRYVWGNEPTAYWTGRYMALLDRLRTTELDTATQTWSTKNYSRKTSAPQVKAAHVFDQTQQSLKKATIKALRSFCQTDAALTSFELFERQLYLRDPDFGHQHKSIASMQPQKGKPSQFASVPTPPRDIGSPHFANAMKPTVHHFGERLSLGLAQNLFRKSSSNAQFPRLTKSCTTSNIMDMQYGCNPDYHPSTNINRDYDGRTFQLNISETRIRAIQEREARGPSRSFNAFTTSHRHISTHTSPMTAHSIGNQTNPSSLTQSTKGGRSKNSSEADISSVISGKKPEYHIQNRSHSSSFNASLEAEGLEAERIRKASMASNSESTSESTRKFRKSESMKKFFDSSIKEVRKISRRVSNNVGGVDDSL